MPDDLAVIQPDIALGNIALELRHKEPPAQRLQLIAQTRILPSHMLALQQGMNQQQQRHRALLPVHDVQLAL